MNMEPNISARSPEIEPKENILLGVLGAVLFSLAGVIVYFLLDQLNFIASISAVVGAYAAVFGYGLFTKRKNSKTGIIVASVVTVIMMVLAVYLCTAYDLYSQVRADGGTITLSTAAGDCLKTIFGSKDRLTYGMYYYELDLGALLKDLLLSLLFTGLGIWSFVQAQIQKKKAEAAAAQQPANGFSGSSLPTDSTSSGDDETK